MSYWKAAGLGGLLCLLWLCGGCATSGGGQGQEADDNVPPVLSNFSVTPPTDGWRGGQCTVRVQATDNRGIAKVLARVSGPNSNADEIPMALMPGTTNTYEGSGPVPANTNSDGKANSYFVTAWAIDIDANSASVDASLAITVPAPDAPLPPPTGWSVYNKL